MEKLQEIIEAYPNHATTKCQKQEFYILVPYPEIISHVALNLLFCISLHVQC